MMEAATQVHNQEEFYKKAQDIVLQIHCASNGIDYDMLTEDEKNNLLIDIFHKRAGNRVVINYPDIFHL